MENRIREHRIDSWTQFVEVINSIDIKGEFNFSEGFIFRGQSDPRWKLSSKLERNFESNENDPELPIKFGKETGWYGNISKNILTRFRENLIQIPGYTPIDSDPQLWAFGRHHGLLTPYLDWSYNPYIATFFAFYEMYKRFESSRLMGIPQDQQNENVVVWKLNIWKDTFLTNDFEIIQVTSKIGTRLHAQQGLFTVLKNDKFYNVEDYLLSRGLGGHLEKIELPHSLAIEALTALDTMGINIFALFPDYLGAAEQANIESNIITNTYSIRKSTESPKNNFAKAILKNTSNNEPNSTPS